MKKVTLKTIVLSDWKAQNISVDFFEKENVITGDNGAGKTSIKKAWCWLLTGFSDPNTNKNSDLFDNKKEISVETPTASVEATIDIDGIEYVLKRTATAKFVRKRGTDLYEKSPSDEYHTYVDNVEMSSTNFVAWINQYVFDGSYDIFQYLVDGDFFMKSCLEDKNKMRSFLGVIAGDVDNSELHGEYGELYALAEQKKGIETAAEYAKQMSASLKKRLSEVPTTIKTNQETISEYKARYDFEEIEKKIEDDKKEIERIDKILLDKSVLVKEADEKRSEVLSLKLEVKRKIEAERFEHERLHNEKRAEFVAALEKAVRANKYVEQRNADAVSNRSFNEKRLSKMKDEEISIEASISSMKEELEKVRGTVIKENEMTCPFCRQQLPEEMKKENVERFEKEKNGKVERIVKNGKEENMKLSSLRNEISSLEAIVSTPLVPEKEEDISTLQMNVAEFDASYVKFEDMERFSELTDEMNAIVVPEVEDVTDKELVSKKKEIQEEIDGLNRKLGVKDEIEVIEEKIACLNGEQNGLGIKIAEYENILIQLKKYNQEKADIISSRLNKCLKYSNIQMFSFQKDGSLVPDLIVKDKNGVSYSTTNAANRIIMSVDVQNFLFDKYGVSMPIWIDEASIINPKYLPMFDTQYIMMMYKDEQLSINGN